MSVTADKAFPNYLETKTRLPSSIWWTLRLATFAVMLLVIWLIASQPEVGFAVFWKILVPSLPLVFATMPGFWRQICPMALLNQIPRTLGFSRDLRLPIMFKNVAFFVSTLAFFILVSLRHVYFNNEPTALLLLIGGALLLAFVGGYFFTGRSGWCGTFCPLAPIQKAYGHAPLVVVRNGYCSTCVGCQKNCYDFNPRAALLSDLEDSDHWYVGHKRFFVAGLPGFAIAFFTAPDPIAVGLGLYYLYLAGWIVTTLGIYMALRAFVRLSDYRAAALSAISAFVIFYWFTAGGIVTTAAELMGFAPPPWGREIFLVLIGLIALRVYLNGLGLEKEFRTLGSSGSTPRAGVRLDVLRGGREEAEGNLVTDRASGRSFAANPHRTLLESIEAAGLSKDFGCRMGMCGADPVAVLEGMENLSAPGDDELATLRRLGLEGRARMACVCRVVGGAVTIDLDADPNDLPEPDCAGEKNLVNANSDIQRVVIVGNGASGSSVADEIRRISATCEIDVIARENHPFYNRMAIGRLLYGRTGSEDLHLLASDTLKKKNINVWLNTQVTAIDRAECTIALGTGETLPYDRLILATGARAFVPPVDGGDLPGNFVLREIADAQAIRAWRQQQDCRHAIVLGGGVLGVEAADALRRLNLKTTIVQRSDRLMDRELDEKGSAILRRYLDELGIDVVTDASIAAVVGDGRVEQVELTSGKALPADICVTCAGIRPNIEVAAAAGLTTNRGVVVSETMRTNDPKIFAVGDVAEVPGAPGGLWAVGTAHAAVAADAIFGGDKAFEPPISLVSLKLDGIDVKGFGARDAGDGIEEIFDPDEPDNVHRRLFVEGGRIVGAVVVGPPGTGKDVAKAIQNRVDISGAMDRLRAFDWSALGDLPQELSGDHPLRKAA